MERPGFLGWVKEKFGDNKQRQKESVKNENNRRQTSSAAGSRPGSKQSGNRLTGNGVGGSNDSVDQGVSRIDVYFAEVELGMMMQEEKKTGRPIVNAIIPGREGQRLGVKVGDIVVMIEKNPVSSVKAFSTAAQNFPRPLCVTFERKRSGAQAKREGGLPGAIDSMKERFQKSKSLTRTEIVNPPQPVITEEEKIQRRQAALMAAEGRSNDWNMRVQRNRQVAGVAKPSVLSDCKQSSPETSTSSNPQTIASVKQAKEQEAETARQMGYNPYAPQMVGLAQARNAAMIGSGGGTGIESSGSSPDPAHQLPDDESSPQQQQLLPETALATDDMCETLDVAIVEEVEPLVAQARTIGLLSYPISFTEIDPHNPFAGHFIWS